MSAVGVVGLGQIGGSVALALRASGTQVVGFDRSAAAQDAARAAGIRCETGLDAVVARCGMIFCCVPIDANRDVLAALAAHSAAVAKPPTLTDVASYKGGTLPGPPRVDAFIAGHPMAGREGSGFASADPALFDGKLWNLVVDDDTALDRLLPLVSTVHQLGADVHVCSAAWHDASVSLVSALPHALALVAGSVSAQVDGAPNRLVLAAGSFHGATRVLGSDPAFFRELLVHNRPTLLPLLAVARDALERLETALRDDDVAAIDRMLAASRAVLADVGPPESVTETMPREAVMGFLLALRDRGRRLRRLAIDGDRVTIDVVRTTRDAS